MATGGSYTCEFISLVPDYLYCNKCILVAREVVITSCCGESFCQACVADSQEQGMSCPVCGETEFMAFKQVKNERQIRSLHVYCSMKERGCVWSGTLDQLDSHLDPHLDNCQYVDTNCPFNCLQTIPKNKVDQHVAQECTKRPHVCQHCGFKATYEEVVDTHLPECKYVPLQCSNMCGVSCEREVMEDHMKICRLEEVECEFSSVGCDGRFIREDQDEHARQNSQKHLTLIAFQTVESRECFLQKLLEVSETHQCEEEKLRMQIEDQKNVVMQQEKKLIELEIKVNEKEKKLGQCEKKLGEQEKKLVEQENKLVEQDIFMAELVHLQEQVANLKCKMEQTVKRVCFHDLAVSQVCGTTLSRKFELPSYSRRGVREEWRSPAMYTHACGYKFCVGVIATLMSTRLPGYYVGLSLSSMSGEFDDQLRWPAKAKFTIELINQHGGSNDKLTESFTWDKPVLLYHPLGGPSPLTGHSRLAKYLKNDSLFFNVSNIELI